MPPRLRSLLPHLTTALLDITPNTLHKVAAPQSTIKERERNNGYELLILSYAGVLFLAASAPPPLPLSAADTSSYHSVCGGVNWLYMKSVPNTSSDSTR